MTDDRIRCTDCRELSATKRCRVAMRGERKDVAHDYAPAEPDLPHRCVWYAPLPGPRDQRMGYERFAAMWAEYKAWEDAAKAGRLASERRRS